jgi:hypothetical protein
MLNHTISPMDVTKTGMSGRDAGPYHQPVVAVLCAGQNWVHKSE